MGEVENDGFLSKLKSCATYVAVIVFVPPILIISFLLGQSVLFWSIIGNLAIVLSNFLPCRNFCDGVTEGFIYFAIIVSLFFLGSILSVASDNFSKSSKRFIGSIVFVLNIGFSLYVRSRAAHFCIFFTLVLSIAYFRLWIDASAEELKKTQTALLQEYCHVPLVEVVIGGIGTVFVNATQDAPSTHQKDATVNSALGINFIPPESPTLIRPTLVLVHGYAAGNGFWMLNLEDLSKRFNVIAIDLPGFGQSTRFRWLFNETDDALSLFVNLIESWRTEVGLDKFALLGHSLGAVVVSAYASSHPSHVTHLILASPAGMTCKPGEGSDDADEPEEERPSSTTASEERKKRFKKRVVQGPIVWRFAHWYWEQNLTPMDLVRLAGPFGRYATLTWIKRRISWSPETSALHHVNEVSFSNYAYQNFAGAASGDRALGSLLSPFAWGRKPLLQMLKAHPSIRMSGDLVKRDDALGDLSQADTSLLNPQHVKSDTGMSWMACLVNLFLLRFLSWSVCDPVVVLSASKSRSAAYDRILKDGSNNDGGVTCPVSMIYGCKAHDWMESDLGLKLAKKLRKQGLKKVNHVEIDNTGHLLFLDDPRAFCEHVERCFFD